MHEDAPEILIVLFDAVIHSANVLLIEEAQHFLLECAAAFAGDDLDQLDLFVDGFLHDAVEFGLDFAAFIVDVVQVELEFGHRVHRLLLENQDKLM